MRINSTLGIVVACSFLLISLSESHAEFRQGSEVTIAEDEVIDDDVYIAAGTVRVNGTTNGDLVVAGQQIIVNGSVHGDLIAAAQLISVTGKISDDVRIAGQTLSLQDGADVGDDLIAAGDSLECAPASRVGGEVRFAGRRSVFVGNIEGKFQIASANCTLSGSFGDDVEAIVEDGDVAPAGSWLADTATVSRGLTVSESAQIEGDLNYHSNHEAEISPDSTIAGNVEHAEVDSEQTQRSMIAGMTISAAKQFFSLLLVGLLIVYIRPTWTGQVVNTIHRRPLASFGWGVLTLIVAVFSCILLLVGKRTTEYVLTLEVA